MAVKGGRGRPKRSPRWQEVADPPMMAAFAAVVHRGEGDAMGEGGLTLAERASGGAVVRPLGPRHWRLALPPGRQGHYRLAQLDDYLTLARRDFPWRPPLRLTLRARASAAGLPGTWGFGFWNDPFGGRLGLGSRRALPTLPNAAWFFHASPPNHLTLRDDLPAQGFLVASFSSPKLPSVTMLGALPVLPLALWPGSAGLLRRAARVAVAEDGASLTVDPTAWHEYALEWRERAVRFLVDGRPALETPVSPRPPLGLVLWIDNQYAALAPGDRLRLGTLPSGEEGWLEVADVAVERGER